MKKILQHFARFRRLVTTTSPEKVLRPDITEEDLQIIEKVRPFTMTSVERLLALIDATRYVSMNCIEGAFVECGVWRGGSSMSVAMTLLATKNTNRDLFLFDTFKGMSQPTVRDVSHDNVSADAQLQSTQHGTGIWCEAGMSDVRANMESTNYPHSKIHYIGGLVEDTIPNNAPDKIALLRLDTDWYESTRHELKHLYPKLVPGGVLIIDDYGHWKGARQATDEFLQELPVPLFLHRIDYTGRIAIKCE